MKRATLVCAFLALAGTGAVMWQQRSFTDMRRSDRTAGFTRAATTDNTNAADEREAAVLREQTKDLPRLRNEVTQLRAHKAELYAARQEHEQLMGAKRSGAGVPREAPPGFISKAQLKNAGFATPESAIETYFWAIREGNLKLAMQALSPDHGERAYFENLPPETREQEENDFRTRGKSRVMASFNDFTVTRREQISEDAVALYVRSSIATNTARIQLKRFGTEWKSSNIHY